MYVDLMYLLLFCVDSLCNKVVKKTLDKLITCIYENKKYAIRRSNHIL
jgi:hypothetical protein